MYTYNVTVNIDDSIHAEWLHWMRSIHMPEVLATGMFLDAVLHEVMIDEEGGRTYAAQYRYASPEDLQLYQQVHAPGLQEKYAAKFGACSCRRAPFLSRSMAPFLRHSMMLVS